MGGDPLLKVRVKFDERMKRMAEVDEEAKKLIERYPEQREAIEKWRRIVEAYETLDEETRKRLDECLEDMIAQDISVALKAFQEGKDPRHWSTRILWEFDEKAKQMRLWTPSIGKRGEELTRELFNLMAQHPSVIHNLTLPDFRGSSVEEWLKKRKGGGR